MCLVKAYNQNVLMIVDLRNLIGRLFINSSSSNIHCVISERPVITGIGLAPTVCVVTSV